MVQRQTGDFLEMPTHVHFGKAGPPNWPNGWCRDRCHKCLLNLSIINKCTQLGS